MKVIYARGSNHKIFVDDDDYDYLVKFRWYVYGRGYAVASINGKNVAMHRMIMGPAKKLSIDHIDRNKTNNQKENLRIVSRSINAQNISPKSNNTSGFVGVSRNGLYWQASIYKNNKRQFLGNFKDKESAAIAYNERALILYGENAYLNPTSH